MKKLRISELRKKSLSGASGPTIASLSTGLKLSTRFDGAASNADNAMDEALCPHPTR
jgi:hypothetical protein